MTMKKSHLLLLLPLLLANCGHTPKTQNNPVEESPTTVENTSLNPLPIRFGDPFILHASDSKYYMYGTSLADGFEAFVSPDLKTWEPCGQVYRGGTEGQWNIDCFWPCEDRRH